jgi:4Fe-4S ferredoxin
MKECKHPAGTIIPVVNFSSCEAKGPCVEVCPYDVFELKDITKADYKTLSFLGKIKILVHGKQKAYATNADKCMGCGLCVSACPEKAISLVKVKMSEPIKF